MKSNGLLLAIDIGNTNTVAGLFSKKELLGSFRFATRPATTSDETALYISGWLKEKGFKRENIKSIIISSVVPSMTASFEQLSEKHFQCVPIMVSAKLKLPVKIEIDSPEQVGADRIANAVAGYAKFGGELIVVDFGTATNFDVVDAKGSYIGGVLIPGPETAMSDLARKAARLYEVPFTSPRRVVGRSTTEALMSGLFYGTVGQVDYIIERILGETKFKKPNVIATGGLAEKVAKHSRLIKSIEPNLTLEGLQIISESNLD
jgi:type III pantothenate kinase